MVVERNTPIGFKMKSNIKNKDINDSKVFFSPNIPVAKLKNAIFAYGNSDISANDILILVDNTIFGNAKDGFFITENYFCARETVFDKPFIINISDINEIENNGNKIFINGKKVANFMIPQKESIEKICKLIEAHISNLKHQSDENNCNAIISNIKDNNINCENKKETNDSVNSIEHLNKYTCKDSNKENIEFYLEKNFFVNINHHYKSTRKTVNVTNSILGFLDTFLSTSIDEQNKSFSRDISAENSARDKQISCACDMITLAVELYKCIPGYENHKFTKYLIDERVTYEFLILVFSRIITLMRIKIDDQDTQKYMIYLINQIFSENIIKPFAAYKQSKNNKSDLSSIGISHIKELEKRLIQCVDIYITNMLSDNEYDSLYYQLKNVALWFSNWVDSVYGVKDKEYFNQRPTDFDEYVIQYLMRIDSQIEKIILKSVQ